MNENDRARWAQFSAELQNLRFSSGTTQRQLASKVSVHYTMIGKIERLERFPQRELVEKLDTALETGGVLTRLWHELTDHYFVPDWFRDALLLEQRATEIRAYESIRVPGLLQTEDYARSLVREGRITASSKEIDQVVTTRVKRLPAIQGNEPFLWFVIKESALLNVVGDETVMRAQLRHILALVEDGTIRVQVLPAPRASIGMREPFRVMTLNKTQSVGYLENTLGGGVVDDLEKVDKLTTLFGILASEAQSLPDSVALIKKLNGDRYGDVD